MGSLGSKLSMVNEMVLPMKEFVNIVFEITEEINGLSQPRNLTRQPMVVRILLDVLMLDLLQVGQPRTSVLAGLQKILISNLYHSLFRNLKEVNIYFQPSLAPLLWNPTLIITFVLWLKHSCLPFKIQ